MREQLVVVTGASRGIGLALAKELADRGHDLLVCADEEDITTAAEQLRLGGADVTAVRSDLATREGVQALVAAVSGLGRPVDVLALNAGIGVSGPFVETPLEDHLRLIALNVSSVVQTARELLPGMVQRGAGRLLVTSSIAAIQPGPWYSTYAASKAFLLSFAEALRYELKDRGVSVTALMPGPTDTAFFDRADMQDTVVYSMDKDDPADVARDAIDGLLAGDDHVVAGSVKNKLQAMTKGAPETVKAAMHAQLTREKK